MFKLTSKNLVKHFSERADAMRGKTLAASITVPDELKWWYFHEFGTTRSYPISPKSAEALRLPETPEHPDPLIVKEVGPPYTEMHPPITPKKFVERVLPDILDLAKSKVSEALTSSDMDPEAAHDALISEVMPQAVEIIAKSMGHSLPGTRADGKLTGQRAEDVYRENAEIVDRTR